MKKRMFELEATITESWWIAAEDEEEAREKYYEGLKEGPGEWSLNWEPHNITITETDEDGTPLYMLEEEKRRRACYEPKIEALQEKLRAIKNKRE